MSEYTLDRMEAAIRALTEQNKKLSEALVLAQEGGSHVQKSGIAAPHDMVNHPPHYQMPGGIETIDYIEAVLAQDYFKKVPGIVAHCVGNILKYASRPTKGEFSKSLRKAAWYCNRAADALEKTGE